MSVAVPTSQIEAVLNHCAARSVVSINEKMISGQYIKTFKGRPRRSEIRPFLFLPMAKIINLDVHSLFFSYKNSFYKNIKADIAEKIRTSLRTLEGLKFVKINALVKFFKKSLKISMISSE